GLVVALAGGWLGFWWFGRRSSRSPARSPADTGFAAIVSVFRSFVVRYPGRCVLSTLLFLIAYAWGAFESYWICHFIGLPVGVGVAFMIETLSVAVNRTLFLLPARSGTRGGGRRLFFAALVLRVASGLALGVVRHFGELIWAALGLWLRWTHQPASASRSRAVV